MNNPSFGLLGGQQPPGGPPGLLGQPQPPMPMGSMPTQPGMAPDMMGAMPLPDSQPQMPTAGQPLDPMMEQALIAALQQPAAPQMPAQPEPMQEPAPMQGMPQFGGPSMMPNMLPFIGNSIADNYIGRIQSNPNAGASIGMPGMPGYDQQQAFANWSAGINQPDQMRPHPDYMGPSYGNQLRMEEARRQADEAVRSASRI